MVLKTSFEFLLRRVACGDSTSIGHTCGVASQ